jgi:hypothetical protein
MLKTKRPVKNRFEETILRKKKLSGQHYYGGQRRCNGYTCDINDATSLREQAEKTCKDLKIQLTFVYIDGLEKTKKW